MVVSSDGQIASQNVRPSPPAISNRLPNDARASAEYRCRPATPRGISSHYVINSLQERASAAPTGAANRLHIVCRAARLHRWHWGIV